MFTGYNSEVEYDGKAFHVQTEDKGLDNPVVESRVYRGGEVVASVLTSYADLADSPDYTRDRIQRRMQEQHQSLIEDLRTGRLEAEPTIRRKALERVLDPDNLVEEYVEDWIEASNLIAPVHQALEQRVDQIRNQEAGRLSRKKRKKEKRTRANLALLVFLISVVAAFELGRISQRSVEPGAEPVAPGNASVSVTGALFGDPVSSGDPDATGLAEDPVSAAAEPAIVPLPHEPEPQPVRPPIESDPRPAAVEAAVPQPAEPTPEPSVPDTLPVPITAVANDTAEPDVAAVVEPEVLQPVLNEAETILPDSGPFEVDEVDRPPASAMNPSPLDTPAAGTTIGEGSVHMKVLIGTDGGIVAVRMRDEITDSDLNKAALGAILHWRFRAGSHRGVPVSVWVPVRLDYSLSNNRMRSVVTVTR